MMSSELAHDPSCTNATEMYTLPNCTKVLKDSLLDTCSHLCTRAYTLPKMPSYPRSGIDKIQNENEFSCRVRIELKTSLLVLESVLGSVRILPSKIQRINWKYSIDRIYMELLLKHFYNSYLTPFYAPSERALSVGPSVRTSVTCE